LHFHPESDNKHVFVTEAPTVQEILDSAARAAASENFALAESLLREAARLQESSLGSQHPDLASTFNNLAIVCEKENKLADAGEFYHRAFAIASASLDSEHPLVLTSRDNLSEFNRVHGAAATPAIVSSDSTAELSLNESTLAAPAPPRRHFALVIGVVAGILLLGALAMLNGTRSVSKAIEEPKAVAETPSTPPAQEKVPVAAPPPSDTSKRTVAPTSIDEPVSLKVRLKPDPTEPRVVEASLCESLSTTGAQWQCAPAADAAAAGSLYFYTRIAAATSTRVHHRWYRNGDLRRDVDLAIQANPSAGYRTYSRQQLDSGEWRVEAVTAQGEVLHEARVAIR
jgi:outer membrane biosynthesis protein TonB